MVDSLQHRDPAWDKVVRSFDSGCLFHTSGWLEYLERSQGVEVVVQPFTADGSDGFHICAKSRQGPFKLAGSPLPRWKTMRMGPLVSADAPDGAVADACETFGRSLGVSMYELISDHVDCEQLESRGWQTEDYGSLVVDLPADEAALWTGLKKSVRGRVKKGRANGLTVRLGVDDQLAHDVWLRSDAIMRHKGLRLNWDVSHAEALIGALAPRGQLLGVRIVAPDGHIAACGLFPFDHRAIHYWAGASLAADRALVPNELMHWAAMEFAVRNGLTSYDMYGSGEFKKKYGAQLHMHPRCIRYYNPAARAARAAYGAALRVRSAGKAGWE